jgi:hypothetical protein
LRFGYHPSTEDLHLPIAQEISALFAVELGVGIIAFGYTEKLFVAP